MKYLNAVSWSQAPVLLSIVVLAIAVGVLAGVAFGGGAAIVATVGFAGAQMLMHAKWTSPGGEAGPSAVDDRVLNLMERSNERRGTSIRDESTGLLNRWYLERRLEEESARCKRYGYSMAVVVLKAAILDRHGISADGWQIESVSAAHRCEQVLRNVDLSASLAPFEFALCLVHCDGEGAERAIERLTAELTEYECSAGVAVFPDDDCQPRAMIELARVRSRRVLGEQIGA